MRVADLQDLEGRLGYVFRNRDLLVRALTHRSFSREKKIPEQHPDNEQFGLIIRGQLDFRLGSDQRRLLKPGDVYYAPIGMPHGDSQFIPDPETGDTWILDIFSPVREEYRNG